MGYEKVHFYKDSNGLVHIRGVAEDSTPVTTPSIVFNIPEEYRPVKNIYLPVTCVGTGISGIVTGLTTYTNLNIIVYTNGDVENAWDGGSIWVTNKIFFEEIAFYSN